MLQELLTRWSSLTVRLIVQWRDTEVEARAVRADQGAVGGAGAAVGTLVARRAVAEAVEGYKGTSKHQTQ